MAALCDYGTCTHTYKVDGYDLEAKTYPREDATEIMRSTFAQTQILGGNYIDGETAGPDNQRPQIVTVHEGIKVKEQISYTELGSDLISPANSKMTVKSCGWFGGSTRKLKDYDVYLAVQPIRQEEEVCLRQLIGTWKQALVGRSKRQETEDDMAISDWMTYAMLKRAKIAIDAHAWNGDWKAEDQNVTHCDGFVKLAVNALGSGTPGEWRWTVAGTLTADHKFVVAVGGWSAVIDFDTDLSTTLDVVVSTLGAADLTDRITGVALFSTIAKVGTTILRVVNNRSSDYELMQFEVVDGTGSAPYWSWCDNRTIKPTVAATGVTVSLANTVPPVFAETPISVNAGAFNRGNVVQRLEELYAAVNDTKPELLGPEAGVNWYLAPNVFGMLLLENHSAKASQFGICGESGQRQECTSWMGQTIIKANYMRRDMVFGGAPKNMHFGTNIGSEATEILTGYEEKCQELWYRNEWNMGFQLTHHDEIFGTFTDPGGFFNFKAAMPTASA